MAGPPLEWFREDGAWTVPDGREGELVALAVCLPIAAWFVYTSVDLSLPWVDALDGGPDGDGGLGLGGDSLRLWASAAAGVFVGYLYVAHYREPIVSRLPDLSTWSIVSLFGGGFGLSTLEVLPATNAVVVALLTAGGTVLVIYLCRLVSPFHEGLSPNRGVEPPAAIAVDG